MRLPERPGRRRDREPDITGNRAYPGISGPIRAYSGHERIVACRMVCRRARRRGRASRAVSSVAGSRAVRFVAWGWSSCAVSSLAGSRAVRSLAGVRLIMALPVSATSRPCRAHGRANGTPVVGHIPAQQPPVADAATGGLRTFIRLHDRGVQLRLVRRRG